MSDTSPPLLADREHSGTPMLPAQWLDETLARARTLLHRDDPFMLALERQREPLNAGPGASVRPVTRLVEEEAVEGAGLSVPL
jgi:hypothetical protein